MFCRHFGDSVKSRFEFQCGVMSLEILSIFLLNINSFFGIVFKVSRFKIMVVTDRDLVLQGPMFGLP